MHLHNGFCILSIKDLTQIAGPFANHSGRTAQDFHLVLFYPAFLPALDFYEAFGTTSVRVGPLLVNRPFLHAPHTYAG